MYCSESGVRDSEELMGVFLGGEGHEMKLKSFLKACVIDVVYVECSCELLIISEDPKHLRCPAGGQGSLMLRVCLSYELREA